MAALNFRLAPTRLSGELLSALREMGADPSFWTTHEPRESEFLQSEKAGELATPILQDDAREWLERWLREQEAMVAEVDSLGEGVEIDALRDRALGLVLAVGAADYLHLRVLQQPDEDDLSRELLDFLASSPNIAFTRALVIAADQLVEEGRATPAVTLYKKAIDTAPRPGLHSELGCLLTYRSGVINEEMGPPGDETLLRVWSRDDHEDELLGNDRLLSGPVAPDEQRALLLLALDAFARAYGYMIAQAENMTGELDEEIRDEFAWELWQIMEGLHLVLARLERPREVELAYQDFLVWDQEANNIGTYRHEVELERRLACYVGLARGWERARVANEASAAVFEAERIVRREYKREEAGWIAQALKEIEDDEIASLESQLAQELAATWDMLPDSVREPLWQAEYLQSFRHASRFDGRTIVSHYCDAVEALVSNTLGKKLQRFLDEAGPSGSAFRQKYCRSHNKILAADELTLGSLAYILQRAWNDPPFDRFIAEQCSGTRKDVARLGTLLNEVNRRKRNPAKHPSPPMHMDKAKELRRDLIHGDPLIGEAPLLQSIAGLFGSPA